MKVYIKNVFQNKLVRLNFIVLSISKNHLNVYLRIRVTYWRYLYFKNIEP